MSLPFDPEPWANDFGDTYPHRHPNVIYTHLAWVPGEGYEQDQSKYPPYEEAVK